MCILFPICFWWQLKPSLQMMMYHRADFRLLIVNSMLYLCFSGTGAGTFLCVLRALWVLAPILVETDT